MDHKCLIEDDIYAQLKARFLHSGRGRPKALPKDIAVNNRLLVQLAYLKEEGSKSRADVERWICDFEDFDGELAPSHLSTIIFHAKDKFITLCDHQTSLDFLSAPANLDFICEELQSLGITKKTFSFPPSESSFVEITNSVVVHLEQYRARQGLSKKHVYLWIHCFTGLPLEKIPYVIDSTCKIYNKLVKNKHRQPEAVQSFLISIFSSSCITKKCDSGAVPVSNDNSVITCSSCLKENHNLLKNENVLKSLYSELKDKVIVLENALSDVSKEKVTLELKLADKLKTIDGLDVKVNSLENDLQLTKSNLRKCQLDRAKVASSKKIIKNKHSIVENSLKNRINELEISNKQLEEVVQHQKDDISKFKNKYKVCHSELTSTQKALEVKKCDTCSDIQIKTGFNNTYSDDVRHVVMSLQSEAGVSAANVQKCITIVSNGIFHHSFNENLPSTQTAVNINSESSVLSNIQAAESIIQSKNVTVHLDGTSRDHKKVVSHQVTLDDGKTLFLGFNPVVHEDASTLLDVTIHVFKTLSVCYSDFSAQASEDILKQILCNINSTMTDRASVMKSFSSKFSEFLSTETGRDKQVHFLHCNAHFLLGLSTACDKAIAIVEDEFIAESGDQIGRDKEGVFKRFNGSSESGTNRVIRTACDVLGPRGDQKNGYRLEWVTFCDNSLIPSFKSNRFNCFFEAAAAIIHHLDRMKLFFSSNVLPDNVNLKMKSVCHDIHDINLMSLLCAIALFYLKVSGPYWSLLLSKSVKYVDFHVHVQRLYFFLQKWSSDPSELFDPTFSNVFAESCTFKSVMYKSVHDFIDVSNIPLIERCLKCLVNECMKVTERQLADFLSGPFSQIADNELSADLNHCPLTNLVGESSFGDLDLDLRRRPNRKMFNRSSAHIFSRNKTSKYLMSKSKHVRSTFFSIARRRSRELVRQASFKENDIKNKVREKMVQNQELKIQRRIKEIGMNADVVRRVKEHGGPCVTDSDVDRLNELLVEEGKKRTIILEVFKDEIRYQKCMKNAKGLTLKGTVVDLVDRLKEYLSQCE